MKTEQGKRIKLVRGEMSRDAFAQIIGSNRNSLARYESGQGSPPLALVGKICEEFNININWILTGEGQMRRGDQDKLTTAPPKTADLGQYASDQAIPDMPSDNLGLGESVELLAKIYTSGNPVLIRAIAANLNAFSEAIDNKILAVNMKERMEILEAEMDEMKRMVMNLKSTTKCETVIEEEEPTKKKAI